MTTIIILTGLVCLLVGVYVGMMLIEREVKRVERKMAKQLNVDTVVFDRSNSPIVMHTYYSGGTSEKEKKV